MGRLYKQKSSCSPFKLTPLKDTRWWHRQKSPAGLRQPFSESRAQSVSNRMGDQQERPALQTRPGGGKTLRRLASALLLPGRLPGHVCEVTRSST